jgi:hypothetical protein
VAERTPRFCFQSSALSPRTSLAATSQDPARLVTQLAKGSRGSRWRSKIGWTITAGLNDKILLHELNGGLVLDSLRVAKLTPGYYATGDDLAAEAQAALAIATDWPVYAYLTANCLTPSMWLRASHRLRNFYLDQANVAATAWNSWDLTGAANVSEATNPPTLKLAQINSLPAVEFDGTNDQLVTAANISTLLGASGVFTAFLVVKVNSAGGATQRILSNASGNWGLVYSEGTGIFRFSINDGGTKNADKAGTQDAFHIITIMQDGTNIYCGVDDTDTAALTATAAGAPANTAEVLTLGGGATNPLNGQIAEALIFNTNLTEEWRRRVSRHLSTKYALTTTDTAPAWPNTYTVAYDGDTHFFTITRASGSINFRLFQATPTCGNHTGLVHHVDLYELWGERAHRDIGMRAVQTLAGVQTSELEATHSIEAIDLDLGAAACRIGIFAGVNDTIDLTPHITTSTPQQYTIAPGIYETPDELAAAVDAAITVAQITCTWDPATNKLSIGNTTGANVDLLFSTGASAGPEGSSAHRTLGWADADVIIATSGSDEADYETWGWNPTNTGIVLDHNSEGGGTYTMIVNDQPNQASIARGPNAAEWTLRGDERLRIGQRGLYQETPVSLGRRYVRLLIDDPSNADAFNELSVLFAGPYLEVSRGFVQGFVHSYEPLSRTSRSEDGSFFLERRQPAHQFTGDARALTLADRTALEFLELVVGVGSPFFFLEDPQSKARIIDWTWYVVLAQPFRFRQSVGDGIPADRYETPFALIEDLP